MYTRCKLKCVIAFSVTVFCCLCRIQKVDSSTLPDHRFEVDVEHEKEENSSHKISLHITHQGWLYKGPDSGQESSIISFTRVGKYSYYNLGMDTSKNETVWFHRSSIGTNETGTILVVLLKVLYCIITL